MKKIAVVCALLLCVADGAAQELPQGYVVFSNGPDNKWNGAHHIDMVDMGGGKVRTWLALPGGEDGTGKEVTAILTEIDCMHGTYQFLRLNEIGENDTVRTLMTEPSEVNPPPPGSVVHLLLRIICPEPAETGKNRK